MTAPAVPSRFAVSERWSRVGPATAVLLESAWLQIRSQHHPTNWILGIVQPASFLLIAALAGRGTGRVNVESAALGAGLLAIWGSTVWSSGSILRAERWQGTLPQIMSRPTSVAVVLFGKSLGSTIRQTGVIAVTVAVTATALRDPIGIERPLPFLAALVGVVASASALGMLLSCVFALTRAAGRISEALMYPIFILGGMLVPIGLLPAWLQPLSTIVSLRWGGELLKAAAHGDSQSATAWLLLGGTTAAYAVLARIAFARVLDRARRQGTLETF